MRSQRNPGSSFHFFRGIPEPCKDGADSKAGWFMLPSRLDERFLLISAKIPAVLRLSIKL